MNATATTPTRYLAPDWFTRRVFNPLVARLTRWGISVKGSRVLEVRGRTSGEVRTTVVNLLTVDGVRYLVAPRGETQWVRNLRADGGAGALPRRPAPRDVRGHGARRCRQGARAPGLPRGVGVGGRPLLRRAAGRLAGRPTSRRRRPGSRCSGSADRRRPGAWSVDRLGRLHPALELRRLGADEVVRVGVDLVELDARRRAPAASTPGARPPWRGTRASPRRRTARGLADVLVAVAPGLVEQDHLVDVATPRTCAACARIVSGEPIRPPRCAFWPDGVCLPRLVLVPQVDRAGLDRAVRRCRSAARTGRTSSRRPARAPPRRSRRT